MGLGKSGSNTGGAIPAHLTTVHSRASFNRGGSVHIILWKIATGPALLIVGRWNGGRLPYVADIRQGCWWSC